MHMLRGSVQVNKAMDAARLQWCPMQSKAGTRQCSDLFICMSQDTVNRRIKVAEMLLACSIAFDLHMIFAFIKHGSIGVIYLHQHILTEHQIRGQETGSLQCQTDTTM